MSWEVLKTDPFSLPGLVFLKARFLFGPGCYSFVILDWGFEWSRARRDEESNVWYFLVELL